MGDDVGLAPPVPVRDEVGLMIGDVGEVGLARFVADAVGDVFPGTPGAKEGRGAKGLNIPPPSVVFSFQLFTSFVSLQLSVDIMALLTS